LAEIKHTPLHQQITMLLGVFLLFSIGGFYNDLLRGATTPYLLTLVFAAMSGLTAAVTVFIVTRLPLYYVVFAIVLQLFSNGIYNAVGRFLIRTFHVRPLAATEGIHFCAVAIFICAITSYICFSRFMRYAVNVSSRLRSELELAHAIQKTLVPVLSLRIPSFEVYGISQPSEKVGGDLVDALQLRDGDTVAYLADVAGHGLPAGILMGMLKTSTRTALRDRACGEGAATLSLLMDRLNSVLPEVKEQHMFATLTALRLNADGRVFYGMAGSPPILHWRAAQKSIVKYEQEQFPLGLLPVPSFPAYSLAMEVGDVLLIATDGVIEVCGAGGVEFGETALDALLIAQADSSLPALAASILESVGRFGKQLDDQTLLLVRRLPL
jgi:serine phosphatase RsbU (regulator of sigma subunit)